VEQNGEQSKTPGDFPLALRFIVHSWAVALGALVGRGVMFLLYFAVFGTPPTVNEGHEPDFLIRGLLAYALTVGPLIETLLGQWLPITVVAKITRRRIFWISASTLVFAALHLSSGPGAFLAALPAGLAVAWTYSVWLPRGNGLAIAAAFLAHVWINVIPAVITLLAE